MHVAFVVYHYKPEFKKPEEIYRYFQHDLLNGIDPAMWGIDRLNIVCRAAVNADHRIQNINIYMRRDELPAVLKWHQRPDGIFKLLQTLNPDIIHAFSLGLPLHFRWLRRMFGDDVRLIGHHTGEHRWIQMRLWLQQFGLRVVDGFVFPCRNDAQEWIKAAVILPVQMLVSLDNGHRSVERELVIPNMYRELSSATSF